MTESQHDLNKPSFWWFDKHPVKAIILYTITILTISFASSYFLFDERKDLLHKAQVELKQVQLDSVSIYIEQYKSRIEFLEQEKKDPPSCPEFVTQDIHSQ